MRTISICVCVFYKKSHIYSCSHSFANISFVSSQQVPGNREWVNLISFILHGWSGLLGSSLHERFSESFASTLPHCASIISSPSKFKIMNSIISYKTCDRNRAITFKNIKGYQFSYCFYCMDLLLFHISPIFFLKST